MSDYTDGYNQGVADGKASGSGKNAGKATVWGMIAALLTGIVVWVLTGGKGGKTK